MSTRNNAELLVQGVEHVINYHAGTVEEKAEVIAKLVNQYYTVDIVPEVAVKREGNHCVNLSPVRIYRLKQYIDPEYKIVGVKLVSVVFENAAVWRPEKEIDLQWHNSGFGKYTGEVNVQGAYGEIKVVGGERGGDAINLRYTPHDSNCRIGVQQYMVRLIYVKEPTINPSTL